MPQPKLEIPLDVDTLKKPGAMGPASLAITVYTMLAVYSNYTAVTIADKGFGVGHTRSTQTKGVWLWGEPDMQAGLPGSKDAAQTAIIYVDTEGFESTGKSDVYDDRIFALSAIISSLLVYNLPETVRESDVEKLSFAVQLAEGFYATSQVRQRCSLTSAAAAACLSEDLMHTLDACTINTCGAQSVAAQSLQL